MGSAASFSSSNKEEKSIFLSGEITSFAEVLVTDLSARQAFVKYIKDGTWVSKFPMEQFDVELLGGSTKNSSRIVGSSHDLKSHITPEKSPIRMSFENSSKTSNTVQSSISRQSVEPVVSARSPASKYSPQAVVTPPAYTESYAEASFSKEEMTAVMFVCIFPYFLDSSVYRHWQLKESVSSKSADSGDIDDSEDHYDKELELGLQLASARQEGRAHQLVLGAAAYFDADHLQTMLESKSWMSHVATVVDKSSIAVTISDAKTPGFPLVYSNTTFQKLSGYTSTELIGKKIEFLNGVESSTIEVNRIQRSLKLKKSVQSEIICYKKNGKTFKNLTILQPVFDHVNEVCFVLSVHCDITDSKSGGVNAEGVRKILDLMSLVPYMLVKQ